MENSKLSIRPILKIPSSNIDERFQNETLRPILKLQHSLLIKVYYIANQKQKIFIKTLTKDSFQEYVNKSLSKDISLRNQVIGLIIGMFTDEEFEVYQHKKSEFNKRIINMVKKRLIDNIKNL
ncbi:conserved hypothetical protein [Tenacibaculum sediminilitoris]|uniref:glyoxalase n=1 Tax=Tenacibaculum sediminilitoris TaxID=1820334 RepID=UPI003894D52A